MKNLVKVFTIATITSTIPSVTYAGFDWGGESGRCSGSGDFKQQIKNNDIVKVGEIPAGKRGVYIKLISTKDVDIQLYDKSTDKKIIHWPQGILNGPGKQSTTYKGVKIEWSGYNGDGSNYGHEYIKITNTTNRTLVMKAFGYQAGFAKVDYSWSGTQGCTSGSKKNGSGSFQQKILHEAVVTVGNIPKGIADLYIKLVSSKDVDIQLYDKSSGKKIVHWPDGILSGDKSQSTSYKGMTIKWSGYNGNGKEKGHEYISISGITSRELVMKAYGYQEGFASVNYYWGEKKSDVFLVEKIHSSKQLAKYSSKSDSKVKHILNKLVTSNDTKSTLKILSTLNELNKLNKLVNGVNQQTNERDQALFVLEFIVRNSQYILGGGALKEGSLVRTAKLLENHANLIAQYTGVANTYVFIEEDGYLWNSNIKLDKITLHPITQYSFSNQSFDYVANNGSFYEKKSYSWYYGHGFGALPFGLYLAEFKRGDSICRKPLFVDSKAESTTSWLLAKGKCDVSN